MKYTITVLQDDIDNGKPTSSRDCAIALAAKRELFTDNLWVNALGIETFTEHGTLPSEARAFIPRFDKKLPVEPFKFEIDMEPKPVIHVQRTHPVGFSAYQYGAPQQLFADTLKDMYIQHTEPFQPKYTAHPSNEYVKERTLLGEWAV